MTTDRDRVRSWLASEAEAADETRGTEAAEEALLQLFERLPQPEPPADFAARVLARARAAVRRRASLSWWPMSRVWRGVVAVSLTLVAATALLGPSVVLGLLDRAGGPTPVRWVADALFAVGEGVRGGVEIWDTLTWLAAALGRVVAQPPVAASLVVAMGVAALALRLLLELVARERSFHHAQSV